MTNKKGSNQFKLKPKYKFIPSVAAMLIFLLMTAFLGRYSVLKRSIKIIDPVVEGYYRTITPVIKENDGNAIDKYVDEAARKFGQGKDGYSKLKSTLHCLLYYETKHGYAMGKGDNGLAEGLFQYHNATWIAFRKQMIKLGLAKEVYTR